MTIKKLIEMVRFELRRYGFSAEGPALIKPNRIFFAKEPATGQAAFSQDWVQPYITIFNINESLPFCKDLSEDTIFDRESFCFNMGIQYGHVRGGSNGYDIPYRLENYHFKEPRLVRLTD